MTRFEQLRILKGNPWRWEVVRRVDGFPRSEGSYKTEVEAQARAKQVGGEVLDRAAAGSGDVFPTPSDA